jgi:hypothetical protein
MANEIFEKMKNAGYELPKKRHSLHEAKVRVNPKTGTMWYKDLWDRLWSYDPRENHFDVLDRCGKYLRINLEGAVLGMKQSTLDYAH